MGLIGLAITVIASGFGFVQARDFVRNRLTYVDAAQKPAAPIVAGTIAALLAGIVVILSPLTAITAVVFGLGVGAGVAVGARANRRRLTGSIN